MQPVSPPRRDPAPSRLAYRLHRLWLTPLVRRIVKQGLPLVAVIASLTYYFSQEENRQLLADKIAAVRLDIENRPEFMVNMMAIDGASDSIAADIREIVPIDFPISSFTLDLEGIRDRIAELDAVRDVEIRIRSGGILEVEIAERLPAAVWRVGRDLELLDEQGHRVAVISSRLERPDLPLLAGAGAQQAVPEALRLLAAASPLRERIRGLVRIGERRWDLVLDRNQRILLPEENAVAALEQAMALEMAQDVMARDISIFDMRNPARPTLRLTPEAFETMRQIKADRQGATE